MLTRGRLVGTEGTEGTPSILFWAIVVVAALAMRVLTPTVSCRAYDACPRQTLLSGTADSVVDCPDHDDGQTQGMCYACGQPVTGSLIYERGEILQVSRNAAEAEVDELKSGDRMNEEMLARIQAKADLRRRAVHSWVEVAKARERVGESEAKLKARHEDLG